MSNLLVSTVGADGPDVYTNALMQTNIDIWAYCQYIQPHTTSNNLQMEQKHETQFAH